MDVRLSAACDFRLVSTYLPFAATIVRAHVFLAVVAAAAPLVPAHVFVAMLLLSAYFDALVHTAVHTSVIAGHVAPVCFAWIARAHVGTASSSVGGSPEAPLALDVLWLAAVHALLVSYACRRKVTVGAGAIIAANAACVLCQLWLSEARVSVLELHVRSAAYYVFVFVHFYVFQTRSAWDVGTHACVGPHLGLHIFFADARLVAASLAFTVVICVRVGLQPHDHALDNNPAAARAPERVIAQDMFVDVEDMAGLLQELRAAKAGAQDN